MDRYIGGPRYVANFRGPGTCSCIHTHTHTGNACRAACQCGRRCRPGALSLTHHAACLYPSLSLARRGGATLRLASRACKARVACVCLWAGVRACVRKGACTCPARVPAPSTRQDTATDPWLVSRPGDIVCRAASTPLSAQTRRTRQDRIGRTSPSIDRWACVLDGCGRRAFAILGSDPLPTMAAAAAEPTYARRRTSAMPLAAPTRARATHPKSRRR